MHFATTPHAQPSTLASRTHRKASRLDGKADMIWRRGYHEAFYWQERSTCFPEREHKHRILKTGLAWHLMDEGAVASGRYESAGA